mgnify:CR=1 FL=1
MVSLCLVVWMSVRTILTALMVVVASSVVLTGGALAATPPAETTAQLQSPSGDDFFKPKEGVNNTTSKYRKGEPSED